MPTASPFAADLLKGKVALVTGGGTGINFGIAKAFGKHGASLAITGRRENVLAKACDSLQSEGIQVIGIRGDVRSAEDVARVVSETLKKYGKIDILINGAAGNFLCPAEDLSNNAFKTVIDIDLNGTFQVSRASFDALRASKGCIINISATLHYSATPWQTHASAAKAGVDSITRSLASEWGYYGIRVNGIAPGPIAATEGMARLSGGVPAEKLNERAATIIPLGRVGTVEDIALSALYLASDRTSGFVSGCTLIVDGAANLYRPNVIERGSLKALQQGRKTQAKL